MADRHIIRPNPVGLSAYGRDRISKNRVVADDAQTGERVYIEVDDDMQWLGFVLQAAHSLSDARKVTLAESVLNVLKPEDRTAAIAASVGRFHSPAVTVDA